MLPIKILEYLYYVSLFILLFKMSEGALVELETSEPLAKQVHEQRNRETDDDFLRSNMEECKHTFNWLCLKIEFLHLLKRLTEQDELSIFPGVSIVRNLNAETIRKFDMLTDAIRNYPKAINQKLNARIINELHNYLRTHYLRFKLINEQISLGQARSSSEDDNRGSGGGGGLGGGGKKGNYDALIAAGLMMKGTLIAMGMGAVALLASKALMVGLMALTLAAALGLKGMMSSKSTSYEIIAKPVYSTSHTHSMSYEDGGHSHMDHGGAGGYGGYSRSMDFQPVPQANLL